MTTITAAWTTHLNVPPPPPPAAPPPTPPAAPPPPTSYTPPVVPPPAPAYVPPPPRKKMNWLWWLLGCGCLLIILVIAGAIWGGSKLWNQIIAPELHLQPLPHPPPPPPTTDGVVQPTTIDEPVKVPSTPAVSAKPGKQTAVKAALKAAPAGKWVAKVNYASADWQRVKVWIGPPNSEFAEAVLLQWDAKKNVYRVEKTEAIEEDEPAAKEPQKPVAAPVKKPTPKPNTASQVQSTSSGNGSRVQPPTNQLPANKPLASGPKPSRARAMAKCLAQAPESGWVAKASNDSGDWTRCSVMIGPPSSEFVTQFTLEWIPDRHNYAIRARQSIGN